MSAPNPTVTIESHVPQVIIDDDIAEAPALDVRRRETPQAPALGALDDSEAGGTSASLRDHAGSRRFELQWPACSCRRRSPR
jgi:hypothetical protein